MNKRQRHSSIFRARKQIEMPQSAVEIVKALLANPTDDENLAKLVSPTATYISLCYSNPALKKLMPYAGLHEKEGPGAVKFTFETVGKIWVNEHFEILAIFGDEHEKRAGGPVNVAVFGKFTYRSTVLGKRYTSPFSFWSQVDLQTSQIVHMQFMEDTVCASSLRTGRC